MRSASICAYKSSKEEVSAFEIKHIGLQVRHEELTTKYQGLDARYKSSKEEFDSLEVKHTGLQTRYVELNTKYQGLDARYKSSKEEFDSLEVKHTGLQARHVELNAKYQGLGARYTSSKKEVGSLEVKFAGLQARYESLNSERESTVNKLEKEKIALNKKIAQLEQENAQYDHELSRIINSRLGGTAVKVNEFIWSSRSKRGKVKK